MHLLSTAALILKITFFDPPLLEPVGVINMMHHSCHF